MRRLALALVVAGAALLEPAPASPVPAESSAAISVAVPHGPVTVGIGCTLTPAAAQGAWIAVFAVDADSTGLTESSVTAMGWWDRGRLDVVVRASGLDLGPNPVDVTTIGERYRVTLAGSWGGGHRAWNASLRSGCGTTDGTVSDLTAVLGGRDVSSSRVPARVVTAGPRDFADALALQGMSLVSGSVSVTAPYLLGFFSARHGLLTVTDPDGVVRRETGLYPSLAVRGGFGGAWRFEADRALSDDPFLLTALAFERR